MKYSIFAAALIAVPTMVGAQSQLERLEIASEEMNADMFVLMANEVAANGGDAQALLAVVPDMTWDDEMRAAGECMLDSYIDLIGEDGVDDMLANMESMIAEISELAETGGMVSELPDNSAMLPEGLTTEDSMRITQECGMIEIQMQRMADSGFSAAMMQAAQ